VVLHPDESSHCPERYARSHRQYPSQTLSHQTPGAGHPHAGTRPRPLSHFCKCKMSPSCILCVYFKPVATWISNNNDGIIKHENKKKLWLESVSKLYRPSDRRLLANLVATFADRGCHVVSLRPYSRFSRPAVTFSFKQLLSCTHEVEWALF
jgi:hypothetical protein